MTKYRISLKSVYSRLADSLPQGLTLPKEISSLSWHQAETYQALQDPNIDVVFNTAMTGDGKSLAAYLSAMIKRTYTLAMYPTNELARDQEKQVQGYKDIFKPSKNPQIRRLTAAILEQHIAAGQISSKRDGIEDFSTNYEILLTNPDIFHYIHNFYYLRGKIDNPDRLFRRIDENYKLFLYDEFHVFSSPQIASVINTILLMKHTGNPNKKFLFLSATPNELLKSYFQKAGIEPKIINPVEVGAYKFESDSTNIGWRQISQPIDLYFPQAIEPNLSSSYKWIEENAETVILKFFQDHPNSKGAIILNSIAAVKKLLPKLKAIFEPRWQVRENTGLTGETEKSQSIAEADLLLGTSTIDVGVDFRINFLIFEAADAGNFIQRFGRLGRHEGFETYQAYALIPNFLVARLFNDKSHPLEDGETYDRIQFNDAIRDSWVFKNDFKYYPKRWGGIQSFYIYSILKNNAHMQEKYPDIDKNFGTSIQRALEIKLENMKAQYYRCKGEKKDKIIDEARSFRGSSQLDCAIYDLTNPDEPEAERFKMYNLPGILSNFVFELWDENSFIEKAEKAGVITTRFDKALCYLKLKDYREVREDWHFYYPGNLRNLAKSGKVQVLPDKQNELQGLEICQRHGYGINQISDAVSRRKLVCFISDRDRNYLRATLGLPMHFQAYPLTNEPEDKSPRYTISFGQDALLLETLTWHWKPKDDEGWIC
ncbi:type I-D CRISPR-associated helicase Cas3' [Nostoc sp. FACHB-152]|uniref:type I-D CRISPR-associated helicase Cas3' n=1 Tax=unclassified Nostoc TaxID=2593658 RepID=UPI001685D888|nr:MULTISPECIES: type I-D CRISPR-associated helicase Cas3' [unclassified Nostoc]MBD2449862.1 type I-D CRISPR-associated helicase Cas3' [Nostoc sp. FACHB-152]MBD2471838.1 type I-D CRISPR-associated helicase Cas3' [Nostoc sp. FACHB-145]